MDIKINFTKHLIFFLSAISLFKVNARDIYAASVNYLDVQQAVNSAFPGDTVYLPSGIVDWQSNVLNVEGGINLIGNGSDNTIIKKTKAIGNFIIKFDCSNGLTNQLFNIGFKGLAVNKTISVENLNQDSGVGFLGGCIDFIVSGCKFSYFGNSGLIVSDSSFQKGVIYKNEFIENFHPSFTGGGYGIAIYGDGFTWDLLELGTENTVFIEDNYFLGNRHHITSNKSSRYVFRHNEVEHTDIVKNYSMTDCHGKKDEEVLFGSRSFEIYENSYEYITNTASLARTAIGIRGGDGVVFNNKISKNIVRTVNLYLEEQESMCGEYPVVNQTKSIYIWDNEHNDSKYSNWSIFQSDSEGVTLDEGVSSDCSLSIKQGRDYFLEKKLNYTPFAYPHPLRNIALNKLTTSNNHNDKTSFRSVDGDLVTSRGWEPKIDDVNENSWWQVDLVDIYDINKIKIITYHHGSRYHNYTIQESLNGTDWNTLITKNDNVLAAETGDIYENLKINTRFLRVLNDYSSINYPVFLIEFEAFGILSTSYSKDSNIVKINEVISSNIINDSTTIDNFSISPNPLSSDETLTISFNCSNPSNNSVNVKITASLGEVLLEKPFQITEENCSLKIDSTRLLQGINFLHLSFDNQVVIKKIIVK